MKSIPYLKFLTANLCTLLLLVFALISHYSLTGLIVYLVGAGMLFLGTLGDSKNVRYGVANKTGFYLFIACIILIGIRLPDMIPALRFDGSSNGFGKMSFGTGSPNFAAALPGLAGMIGFIIASSKVKSYVLKICFGSLAQTFGFLLFYGIFGLPIRTFPFIVAVEALFAFCRVYASKNIIYNGDSGASKRTAHSFMALIICACVAVATLLYPGYAISATNGEHIAKLVKSLTEGFNLPVFVTVMAVAAALFMFSELKSDVKGSADAYLAVSLAGLAISIRVLLTHLSIGGAIICAASAVAYYLVGFSMLSFMPSSDKSNPIYWMLGKGRFAAVLYSAIVSAMAAFSILFMYRGSIVSYLILVCGVVLALTSKRIFRGLAAAEAIRWQIILLTVYAFTMSVSVINGTIGKTWTLLTAVFVLFSIVMWGLGLRDGVNLPKKYRAFKVAGCVIAGAISVIAVITFG